ncbi:MAG: hypothetical protein AAF740_05875 [Bacteroidota bacterium]
MRLLAFLICFVLTFEVQAQNLFFSFGLGSGIDLIRVQDQASSPLSYRGFGLPITLEGFGIGEKWLHRAELSVISSTLSNAYPMRSAVGTELLTWNKLELNYHLLRRWKKESSSFIGVSFRNTAFFREYNFLDGTGWDVQSSLGVSYVRAFEVSEKTHLYTQATIPMLAYIHRKPDLTLDEAFLDDLYNRSLLSLLKYGRYKILFNDWLAANLEVILRTDLSSKLTLQARLGVNYYRITFPERVSNVNFPIQCALHYRF